MEAEPPSETCLFSENKTVENAHNTCMCHLHWHTCQAAPYFVHRQLIQSFCFLAFLVLASSGHTLYCMLHKQLIACNPSGRFWWYLWIPLEEAKCCGQCKGSRFHIVTYAHYLFDMPWGVLLISRFISEVMKRTRVINTRNIVSMQFTLSS